MFQPQSTLTTESMALEMLELQIPMSHLFASAL